MKAKVEGNIVKTSVDQDVLKIIVLSRYGMQKPAAGFIKGFGLKTGAMASSIAHDSHNVICIGENDTDIVNAVNYIVENRGGIVISRDGKTSGIPLPVAGLMTDQDGRETARSYDALNVLDAFEAPSSDFNNFH